MMNPPPDPSTRRASALTVTIVGAMLATWLPHYLTWPWWPDADAWATMAQGWDAGFLPYRDVSCINFPGQIYLSWLLGKTLGWGRTAPYYAVDAALLIGLGPLLATWGRRRFGTALPGLVGWASAVAMYCGLNYTMVAQRDWQGPLLAVAGLVVLQTWPGMTAVMVSAGLTASGFIIRPHIMLFVPPILLAIACDSADWRIASRRLAAWCAAFAAFAILTFLPLILQGLVDDLVRGVRQATYGSGYGKTTPASVASGVLRQLGLAPLGPEVPAAERFWRYVSGWKVLGTVVGLGILLGVSTPSRRRVVLPWLATLLVVTLYAPLHPKSHGYLVLPLRLVWSVGWGLLAWLVLERIAASRSVLRSAVFLAALVVAVPGIPAFCLPVEAFDAIFGSNPNHIPETARPEFFPYQPNTRYRYDDYRRTLNYLRKRTSPETRVATILRNVPFPAINGPSGRVSPLPAESGVIFLWSVNPKLEPTFVEAIDRAPSGSVVVWSPQEVPFTDLLKLDALCAAIRRQYRAEAKFGAFEVWRKP